MCVENILSPTDSEVIMTEVVYPNDSNPLGILQGGKLIQWMDIASAVCAQNHTQKICVTASVDKVLFRHPAKIGDIILIHAKITRTFKASMEIKVVAHSKKYSERTPKLINEAYFTFVAIDEYGKPSSVDSIAPQTEYEKLEYDAALLRRQHRINIDLVD
jgi:acyl-CoA hydrolase